MNNLIYFTIGNNIQYINLAQLCINSLYKQKYNGDILFITNDIYKNAIQQYITTPNDKTYFLILDSETNLVESSANKLKIYKFQNIQKYQYIICCDLDILWINHPDIIFNLIIDNHIIYISNDNKNYTMAHKYWGGDILSDREKRLVNDTNTIGLNAGLFAFHTNAMNHIIAIDNFFNTHQNLVNECLEQPFINAYLYRKKAYSLLPEKIVSHNGYNYKSNQFDGVVLHFAGGPGNYSQKVQTMENYYTKYL